MTSPHPRRDADSEGSGLDETGVTTISVDYCFVSGENDDDGAAGERPVLIMVDSKSGALHALPVEKNGGIPRGRQVGGRQD